MARIETDPNYSTPTFSRATAATDIFKKEDVQNLAAAMSAHTHNGAGNGLAIAPAAGSIPGSALVDGSITSAKIANGTIGTDDLAANAATHPYRAVGLASGPSTTSSTYVVLPDMTITLTVTEPTYVLLTLTLTVTVSAGYGFFGWNVSPAPTLLPAVSMYSPAGPGGARDVSGACMTLLPAGTFTITGVWMAAGGGTLTCEATSRELIALAVSR